MRKKKRATGAISYMLLFLVMLLLVIVMIYMLSVARIITHQRDVDDALSDASLSALVIDDSYYFATQAEGDGVFQFKDTGRSWNIFKSCLNTELPGNELAENLSIDEFTLYEVAGDQVRITNIASNGTASSVYTQNLAGTCTPNGVQVLRTGVYAKVSFDLKSITGTTIRKARDIYCTVKENEE